MFPFNSEQTLERNGSSPLATCGSVHSISASAFLSLPVRLPFMWPRSRIAPVLVIVPTEPVSCLGPRRVAMPDQQGQHVRNVHTGSRAIQAAGRRRHHSVMTDAEFDTLAVTCRLRSRDIDRDQAEAVRTRATGGIATMADIEEMKADVAELRTNLHWVKAVGAGIVGMLIAAFGFVLNMLAELGTGLAALASGG